MFQVEAICWIITVNRHYDESQIITRDFFLLPYRLHRSHGKIHEDRRWRSFQAVGNFEQLHRRDGAGDPLA